jgi:hypothetical protein
MLKILYRQVFCGIYNVISAGEKEIPVFTTLIIMSFLQCANIIELILLVDLIGFNSLHHINQSSIIALMLVLIVLNSSYIYQRGRYKKMLVVSKDEGVKVSLVWYYILFCW